jgi:CubicO group peptidase (beta-lactamase class C family)
MAKLGYLWLHNGRWENRQIVPADYMRAAVEVHSRAPWGDTYGYGIWVHPDRHPPIFEANGRGGQRISVIPEKDMAVVMTGGGFEPGDVGAFIFKALKTNSALPPNAAGFARLRTTVIAATKAPAPKPVAPAPDIAKSISGKSYLMSENVLGIKSLTLNLIASPPLLVMAFANGDKENRPLGLDGATADLARQGRPLTSRG